MEIMPQYLGELLRKLFLESVILIPKMVQVYFNFSKKKLDIERRY